MRRYITVWYLQGNPGLGASETVYSLAAGMYNGGKIMGTLSVAIFTRHIGFKFLFTSGVTLQMIGFLIYGLSVNGWMIVLSRALVGFNSGIFIALPFAYFGKSVMEYSKLMELTRKKGKKLKNQLVYLSGLITTSNCVLTLSKVLFGSFACADKKMPTVDWEFFSVKYFASYTFE